MNLVRQNVFVGYEKYIAQGTRRASVNWTLLSPTNLISRPTVNMSILAGATQSSQGDSSLIAGIHNEDLSFAFASQEEIESEIQDSTLGLTLKRVRDEAFGGEDGTDVKKKFSEPVGRLCNDGRD